MYIPNFNFLGQFGGELGEEQHFFEVRNGGKPHIFPPNWLRWLIFGYVIQLQIFYQLAKKGTTFAFLTPQHPLPQIGANWILTPKSWKSQKAHLGLLPNIHNKFQLPTSIWRRVMRETNSRNERNEKIRQKIIFLRLRGVEMGLKGRDPKKTDLVHLLNIHT